MKTLLIAVGALSVFGVMVGCNDTTGKRVEKVVLGSDKPVAVEAKWLTSFEEAKKVAAEKDLPILVDFSGSDWCGWCIKLDKEVFSKVEFKKYAKNNLVLFMVDFPRSKEQPVEIKKQNEALAQQYGVRGFPTVLLLDATGQQIGKTGYQRGGPEKYIEHIKGIISEKN